jgi:glyoxylase-like metal-dependent hydrolase (beta-lactamase superfamily II)
LFTSALFSFNYSLKPYKIIDGVHCFFGLPSEVSSINGGNMINSCYIETKDGYIVIDSGPTYQYAQSSYTIMEKIKKIPVKYVINTASDEVHVLGSDFYKEQGALIFGPENYQKYFKKKQELILSKKLSKDAFLNTRLIPLDQYIKNDMKIISGDITFEIKTIEEDNAHLVVYIPKKKILFSGDMVFNNRIAPLKDERSILVWQKALKNLKKLDWKDTVSSHGLMTRRSAFNNTEIYLTLLENKVKDALKNKESKVEAIKHIVLPYFREDKLYSVWHSYNVASVYDELYNKKEKSISSVDLKKYRITKEKEKNHSSIEINTLHYLTFQEAVDEGKKEKKIVLLKIRSTTCKYCDQLDKILSGNEKVKLLLNQYFKVVKFNIDCDSIPLNLNIQSTPTLVFLNPQNKEKLMQVAGIEALGELLEVLQEAIDDGHNGGYLKK